MRKIIAAINMTLDGFCDHTAVNADDELHQHYSDLIKSAGVLLYGRITYQLMESYWPTVVATPTGNKSTDDFALSIQNVPKVVFSHSMQNGTTIGPQWENVRLAKRSLTDEVMELRKQSGNDIFAGSPSMITSLTNLKLIDEYQLCIHPVIAGKGLPLFKNITERVILDLIKTKALSGGAVIHYYRPQRS